MRRFAMAVLVVVAVGLAAYGGYAWSKAEDAPTPTTIAVDTAAVVRTDLIQTETLDGKLGYGTPETLTTGLTGTVTGLPEEGALLSPGDAAFEVDGEPIVVLRGARPAWRTLERDIDSGPDVLQLETALAELGLGPEGWEPDREFDADTGAAIEALRERSGMAVDDALELGRVVFLAGPVRVGATAASVGELVQPGAHVFEYTEPEQVVSMELAPDRLDLVAEGDEVIVTLPDDREIPGRIVDVGRVVVPAGPEPDAPDVVEVTIELDQPPEGLDQAPVEVEVESERASGVLAVPVRALLALSDGGYAVEIDGRLVGVELGDFAEGLVEVTGALEEGDQVAIPR